MKDNAILLNDRLGHLLLKLEQDLKRLKRVFQENKGEWGEIKTSQNLERSKKDSENNSKKETEADQEDFLADHLKELKTLKKISTFSLIRIKAITWFLKTAIFALLDEMPEEFSIKHIALYECMLEKIRSFPKKGDFLKHKQLLLGLKNEENESLLYLLKKKNEKESKDALLEEESKRKKQIPVRLFFLTLDARKRSLREVSSKGNTAPAKRIKLTGKISPLALPNNRLFSQVDDECYENLPGLKLS